MLHLVAVTTSCTSMPVNQSLPLELFFDPKNVGEASPPSFVGRSASFHCGASLRISLHIDESQRIVEAKFKAAGCSMLVASASLLTDQILGQTTAQAAGLGQCVESIVERLGPIETDRMECSALPCEALVAAIREYSNAKRDSWEGETPLICTCFAVTERRIEEAIEENQLDSVSGVIRTCNAGAGCRSCWPLIEDILDDCRRGKW